jgi:hypothetical protein
MFETAFRLCHFAVSGTISLIDRVLDSDPEDSGDFDTERTGAAAVKFGTAAADVYSRLAAPSSRPDRLHRYHSGRRVGGIRNAGAGGCSSGGPSALLSSHPAGVSSSSPGAASSVRIRSRRRVVTLQVRTSSSSSSSCSSSSSSCGSPLVLLSHSGRAAPSWRRSNAGGRRRSSGGAASRYIPRLEVIPEEHDTTTTTPTSLFNDSKMVLDGDPRVVWEDSILCIQSTEGSGVVRARA